MQPGDGCSNRLHALHRDARADPGCPRRSRGARRAIRQPHRPGRTRLGDRLGSPAGDRHRHCCELGRTALQRAARGARSGRAPAQRHDPLRPADQPFQRPRFHRDGHPGAGRTRGAPGTGGAGGGPGQLQTHQRQPRSPQRRPSTATGGATHSRGARSARHAGALLRRRVLRAHPGPGSMPRRPPSGSSTSCARRSSWRHPTAPDSQHRHQPVPRGRPQLRCPVPSRRPGRRAVQGQRPQPQPALQSGTGTARPGGPVAGAGPAPSAEREPAQRALPAHRRRPQRAR